MKSISNNYFQINPLQFLFILVLILVVYFIYLLKKHQSPQILPHQSKKIQINHQKEKDYYNIINKLDNRYSKIIDQNGNSSLIFNGQKYDFYDINLRNQFPKYKQTNHQAFKIIKSTITKIKKDGQWTKIFNLSSSIPNTGKYYFRIIVVKNQYFIKKQINFNNQITPNMKKGALNHTQVTVNRSDIVIGFLFPKIKQLIEKQSQEYIINQVQKIIKQSQKQFNTIKGIIAYGFNGRIYCNGELRTQQKVVKKNKIFTVLINKDEGYLCWLIDDDISGYCVLQQNIDQMIPFIQMFAQGSSVIISS